MKRALVLSGGGANGAFQFGALKYIHEEVRPKFPSFQFDIIAGVSVGAINGAMLSMNKFEGLTKIWSSPSLERLIYRGKLEVFSVMMRLISQERSVLDNEPLFSLLQRYVKLSDIHTDLYDLRIGAVSLKTGKLHMFRPQDFDSDEEFQKAILASTAIPILWEPVDEIRTRYETFSDMVDGSIRDTSPLGHVIHDYPDEVTIINCRSPKIPLEEENLPGKSIYSIARRALVDIAIDEIFINDLREFLTINDLVRQAKEQAPDIKLYRTSATTGKRVELRQFQTILIEPDISMGSILDFHPDRIQERISLGFNAAKKAFEGYNDRLEGKMFSNI